MLGDLAGGARKAARAIMGDAAKGRDPAGERKEAVHKRKRKAAHEALTLAALLEQWEALRLADKRERYAAEAVRAVRHAFAKHLSTPAADLDRAAVIRVLDDLTKDGKTAMASRRPPMAAPAIIGPSSAARSPPTRSKTFRLPPSPSGSACFPMRS